LDKNTAYFIFFLLLYNSAAPILGQVQKDTTALSEIILQASPIRTSIQKTAASVSFIARKDLDKTDGVILTSVLNKIAGVYMQQGSLNTNRITIRGIGARSQYGTNKVKAYFEAIPLTSGEGETVLEDIDLESIGSIEITKGPNSTSFGSGLGGVIHLFARETPLRESFGKSATTFGSFGLLKQNLSAGYGDPKSNLFSSYTNLQSDGFRANSSYDRKSLNLHGKQKLNAKGSISYLGIFTRLKAFIPSSLNEDDFRNHPEKAAGTWAASKGNESSDKFLMGIGYHLQFSKSWASKTSVFANLKKANEDRPFDILKEKTNSLGFRSTINYKSILFSLPFEASLGTELLSEKYNFSLFKNLYLSEPGWGSITGAEFSRIQQHRNYINYFLQIALQLLKDLHFEGGLAYNTTKYSLQDIFQHPVANQQAPYSFGTVLSPRLGLSYQVTEGANIYSSISKGFSVPSVAETLTATGQINTNLKPEMGWNYELAFKGNWLGNTLYTEAALYSTQITNLLVARRTAEDQYVGINAGASSHIGMEFSVNYRLIKASKWQITSQFSGTINDFKFKDFVDGDADYSGNRLTGVPKVQWNLGFDINTTSGFSLNSSYRSVGKIPMNDQNSKYSDAYKLLDMKAAYTFKIQKFLKTELSTGINNTTNSHYAASILPNAIGFGNIPPRYYYPGNPRNFYGGISVSYVFL
jgi:iron complex outermembrane receptor protein